MILPLDTDDTSSDRWLRLHDQLTQTEDPDERDAILEEMDEVEYELGEAFLAKRERDDERR